MKSLYWNLDKIGRIKLSKNFQMRQFLYSEVAITFNIPNIPDDLDLAVAAGRNLCEHILEPLVDALGPIVVRSGFRSCAVNDCGHRNRMACASNEKNYAHHIWDRLDANGKMGATACIYVPSFNEGLTDFATWQDFAWWMDERLDHNGITFFKRDHAFNISWHEDPDPTIFSTLPGYECLKPSSRDNRRKRYTKTKPTTPKPVGQGTLI